MLEFAEQTGVSSAEHPPRRYLWTDAHAVCNFLSLYHSSGDDAYRQLALSLIDQVHSVLGRHRSDDPRSGWISGLSEDAGSKRPTAGGLRIGKQVNERGPGDAFDERLEWDRDGQYFHYLTKWMHALARASAVTGKSRYYRMALELAQVAHERFTAVAAGSQKRLLWKMCIDLSRPLVPSSGLHDPLDAFITYNELACHAKRHEGAVPGMILETEIADSAAMIRGQRWHTADPLGIGGLLFDTCRAFQLAAVSFLEDRAFVAALTKAAVQSLDAFAQHAHLSDPAAYRLAFRELGLSIGLRAVPKMRSILADHPQLFDGDLRRDIEHLAQFMPLGQAVEHFWSRQENQQAQSWQDHLDINRVMLATSLLPDEFLTVD